MGEKTAYIQSQARKFEVTWHDLFKCWPGQQQTHCPCIYYQNFGSIQLVLITSSLKC